LWTQPFLSERSAFAAFRRLYDATRRTNQGIIDKARCCTRNDGEWNPTPPWRLYLLCNTGVLAATREAGRNSAKPAAGSAATTEAVDAS